MTDLATATGPKYVGERRIEREGVQGLVVKALTGMSISDYLREKVFHPLHMNRTEWASVPYRNLVGDYTSSDNFALVRLESSDGHEREKSIRKHEDLAAWGYLHLNRGRIGDTRIIAERVFDVTEELNAQHPSRRILGWYHQQDWYYATGAAGCHCVVFPRLRAVGVRMLNKYTSDYATDQLAFNRLLFDCLSR